MNDDSVLEIMFIGIFLILLGAFLYNTVYKYYKDKYKQEHPLDKSIVTSLEKIRGKLESKANPSFYEKRLLHFIIKLMK